MVVANALQAHLNRDVQVLALNTNACLVSREALAILAKKVALYVSQERTIRFLVSQRALPVLLEVLLTLLVNHSAFSVLLAATVILLASLSAAYVRQGSSTPRLEENRWQIVPHAPQALSAFLARHIALSVPLELPTLQPRAHLNQRALPASQERPVPRRALLRVRLAHQVHSVHPIALGWGFHALKATFAPLDPSHRFLVQLAATAVHLPDFRRSALKTHSAHYPT